MTRQQEWQVMWAVFWTAVLGIDYFAYRTVVAVLRIAGVL
jgi:hypothetical protein